MKIFYFILDRHKHTTLLDVCAKFISMDFSSGPPWHLPQKIFMEVVTEPKYPLATATHVKMMVCVLMIGVNTFASVEITSLEETAIKERLPA